MTFFKLIVDIHLLGGMALEIQGSSSRFSLIFVDSFVQLFYAVNKMINLLTSEASCKGPDVLTFLGFPEPPKQLVFCKHARFYSEKTVVGQILYCCSALFSQRSQSSSSSNCRKGNQKTWRWSELPSMIHKAINESKNSF